MSARRTRIKFCGMTRPEDIALAVSLGVDAIGLILVPASPRALDLARAVDLRRTIPPLVTCVALVRDAEPAFVADVVERLRPDLLQFHGREPAADCRRAGLRYLKAIPMGDPAAGLRMLDDHTSAAGYVFDSHGVDGIGGTGRVFDWNLIPAGARRCAILAGGLEPGNVGDAVRAVRPFAVDVSSGIEAQPGVKCPQRMRDFVAQVRGADESEPDQGAEQ
ncbi:phosphoribosylanthranilate isomerase [Pseudomarimonas salicorniae]|uniref:N-(5'-phosphoribosyl)anthranilate isomerase n=1 Tax=Pseudomarimonas salicorniae TaxID=2933270 RepID=A0ABT0GKW8_9GAMM|nr:phosphoribosylanthranilate isomerase [Lysobacter sp. CAU 1642]MCK7594675.1 phosphoribosylanthranilate isomerase [Lysobacter sp. CAU 1642]